ncbi:hypothetical protein MMC07_009000, partial [Pseudocyphellaria aurata]|nr:hypothetical protein [Pseudocyphellaria aurata]
DGIESSGELGLGVARNAIDVKRPRLNPFLSSREVGVVHVATVGMHSAALTHDNLIYTWGVNDQGALGRDTTWTGGLRSIDDSGDEAQDTNGLNPRECTPNQKTVMAIYFPRVDSKPYKPRPWSATRASGSTATGATRVSTEASGSSLRRRWSTHQAGSAEEPKAQRF